MADVGSIAGGGLSSWLIKRGASVNLARKTAFLACALCAVPVMKDYLIPFLIAGSAYLVATAVIHLLLPRLEPMP
jgi:MFS transporter, ACS family, hexuronate transporter